MHISLTTPTAGAVDILPYWQVNVAEKDRTEDCPVFLQNLSAKDIGILQMRDDEYHVLTWPEVSERVRTNRLDLFQRAPSDLRRYRKFLWELNQKYGSVMSFIMAERLHWTPPIIAKGRPFELDEDLKILYNDWPYGIDPKIVHLVVWTKFELPEDPLTGDLKDEVRAEIDAYVDKTFRTRVPSDQVTWFKNWASLKSVEAVEHFHVMIFDPDPKFIEEITQGDVPVSRR